MDDAQLQAYADLSYGVSSLLQSGLFSDVPIKCKTRIWHVHSFILTSSSTFFRGALTGDFKEAHKKLIDLSNEEEEYLDQVITFMYTRNYPSQEDKDVLRNAHIYGLALRLDLPFLADMARAQFQCDIFGMSRECINSIFTQLASTIYQHTPEGDEIRKLFVEIMTEVWFVFLDPKVLEEAVS